MLYGSKLRIPLTSFHFLAAKQEPYQKADLLLTGNIEKFSGKKSRE